VPVIRAFLMSSPPRSSNPSFLTPSGAQRNGAIG
jgi:hypothetical protein